jgi:membrane protease YdiL (CAAX protease family)
MSGVVAGTEAHDYLLRGPIALWLTIFASGALAEEFWRALCILAFHQNGYSAASAVLLLAFAFAEAHVAGLPPRIPGGLENVAPEMGIGVILGVLIIWSGSLLPACLASMAYYTSNLFWLRSHYTCHPRPN